MQHLTQKLDQILYEYDSSEFMPIFEDGKLLNRRDYVAYKIKCILRRMV